MSPGATRWQCKGMSLDLTHPLVMGVLNVTPDSFSDGGRHADPAAALEHALALIAQGADIIDVGGESTRPGSLGVEATVECERIVPVIERLASLAPQVPISVDTTKLEVMQAATAAGAVIVNDIRALTAPGARAWASRAGVGVCLMHMQGEPRTMQLDPTYHEVVGEVAHFLRAARAAALEAGIAPEAIVLDPGLGFGKRPEHNLALLKHLSHLVASVEGAPVLIGASRKSLIARVLGAGHPAGTAPQERLYGGLGIAAWAVSQGARIVRTHDVAATCDAVRLVSAIMQGAIA
jgi:dihydropteroate synthase